MCQRSRIVTFLLKNPGSTSTAVNTFMGGTYTYALKELFDAREVTRVGLGTRAEPYRYSVRQPEDR